MNLISYFSLLGNGNAIEVRNGFFGWMKGHQNATLKELVNIMNSHL